MLPSASCAAPGTWYIASPETSEMGLNLLTTPHNFNWIRTLALWIDVTVELIDVDNVVDNVVVALYVGFILGDVDDGRR